MYVYDAAGSDLEKILHYNFYHAWLCDDNEELSLIWINFLDLINLLGNYQTITPEQAQQELLTGHYVASVPYDVSSAKEIAQVELMYSNGPYDRIYVPYYKFYVNVTDAPSNASRKAWRV